MTEYTEDPEVPSRQFLKDVMEMGTKTTQETPLTEHEETELEYDQGKIDSTFDGYDNNPAIDDETSLDDYAGMDPDQLPEEAQAHMSTAISYAMGRTMTTSVSQEGRALEPEDLNATSRQLLEVSSELTGMAPAHARFMHEDSYDEMFGGETGEIVP